MTTATANDMIMTTATAIDMIMTTATANDNFLYDNILNSFEEI